MLERIEEIAVYEAWPEAEEYLRKAIDSEDNDKYVTQLKARIFGNMSQLWQVKDPDTGAKAYAVTSLNTNDGLVITAQIYIAAADDLESFVEHMDQFMSWALRHNASFIEIIGRKGWEKVLRPHGFTHNYTSLLKRITEELH